MPFDGNKVAMTTTRDNENCDIFLALPELDFTDYTNIQLEYHLFKHSWTGWPPVIDRFEVVVSVDEGEWTTIAITEAILDMGNSWVTVHLNLNDYRNTNGVKIAFKAISNSAENIHLDYVTLTVEEDLQAPQIEKITGNKVAINDIAKMNLFFSDANMSIDSFDAIYSFDNFSTSESIEILKVDTLNEYYNFFYKDGMKRSLYEVTIPAQNELTNGILRITSKDDLENDQIIDIPLEWYEPLINYSDSFEDENYQSYSEDLLSWDTFDLDQYPDYAPTGMEYHNCGSPKSFILFNRDSITDFDLYQPYDGDNFLASFKSGVTKDVLVSPAIKNIGETQISFYAKQTSPQVFFQVHEKIVVKISENSIFKDDYIQVGDTIVVANLDWQNFSMDLTDATAGMDHFYISLSSVTFHQMAQALLIDKIEITNTAVDINEELEISNYKLEQNYPNPFNPTTKINYTSTPLSDHQTAGIVVYNATGQLVWSSQLTAQSSKLTGSITFDGSKFNSGVYYYSLIIDGRKMDTKSMILIK